MSGLFVFLFKHKTANEMRISDWSSDVSSSDLKDQDDEADEEEPAEIAVVGAVAFGLVGGGGALRGFLGRQLDLLGDRAHAILYAAGHVARLEFRRDDVADDAARQRVGEDGFEAVADRDTHPPLVRRDQEHDAVVLFLVADLPLAAERSEEHTSE